MENWKKLLEKGKRKEKAVWALQVDLWFLGDKSVSSLLDPFDNSLFTNPQNPETKIIIINKVEFLSLSLIFHFLSFCFCHFWVIICTSGFSKFRFFWPGNSFFLVGFGVFGSGFRLESGIHDEKDSNSLSCCWLECFCSKVVIFLLGWFFFNFFLSWWEKFHFCNLKELRSVSDFLAVVVVNSRRLKSKILEFWVEIIAHE